MEFRKFELLKEIKTPDGIFPIGTIGILCEIDKKNKTCAIFIKNYGLIVKLEDIKILDQPDGKE